MARLCCENLKRPYSSPGYNFATSKKVYINKDIHSRDMKMQHIKFEILSERLTLFKCNFIQLNFVLNILVMGRFCNAKFHPFVGVRDDVTRSLDVCHR